MNDSELTAKGFALRRDVLDMIYRGRSGHFGGDFSVMDILVALYYRHMNISPETVGSPGHDRLVLSKGHSVEALYAVLADRGFFPAEDLNGYGRFGTKYIGHPSNKVCGVETNSGSLGHGLSVGVGMALAGKMDGAGYRVYVVMGDGELAEGSVWEGAMAAGHFKLDNLIAFVDRNRLQISGPTESVMAQESLRERWTSFGWHVLEVSNGHNISELNEAIRLAKDNRSRPSVVICNTIKGYGFSEAENRTDWHHRVPSPEQYAAAMSELTEREAKAT